MRRASFFPVFFLLLDACIDPLAVKLPSQVSKLVVDGLITNDPGPYEVRLFYSSGLKTRITEPQVESGAQVWIFDDLGIFEQLTEATPGVYLTSASGMRGQFGRSYYVKIKTSRGSEYRSDPELLSTPGEMDSLYVEFEKDGYLLDDFTYRDAFSVFVNARGTENNPNLFRWRWKGTYKVKTFPELRVDLTLDGPVPDPDPCSGYILRQGFLTQIGPCTCCICWTTEANDNAIISDNRHVNDLVFNRVLLSKLPASALRFYEKYYMEVEQLSVSERVYEFWKLVDAQEEGTGNLFQPNSIRVRGNISCLTDPDEETLGIFSVSGSIRRSIFIDASMSPFQLEPLPVIGLSCLESLLHGTTEKPPFW